jgi:putative membrane protein
MMAWIRTSTSLISFGFGIYKFFQLDLGHARSQHRLIGPREFALLMVGTGLLCLVLGTLDHWNGMKLLGIRRWDMPRSSVAFIAVLLTTVGVLAFVAVILRQ